MATVPGNWNRSWLRSLGDLACHPEWTTFRWSCLASDHAWTCDRFRTGLQRCCSVDSHAMATASIAQGILKHVQRLESVRSNFGIKPCGIQENARICTTHSVCYFHVGVRCFGNRLYAQLGTAGDLGRASCSLQHAPGLVGLLLL